MLSILNINNRLRQSSFNRQFFLFILQKKSTDLDPFADSLFLSHLLSVAFSILCGFFPPYFLLSFHGDSLSNY